MTWIVPLAGAVAGAIIGSFLATLILRWPRGEQVLIGRSRCDSCGETIPATAMVPLLSYMVARGRCGRCAAQIDPLHFQVELGAAILAGTALALQPNVAGVVLALFWLLLVAPALLDARHMWLPDALTLVLALVGLALGGLVAGTPLVDRLIGGAAGYLSLALISAAYRTMRKREGLGGGDPKLLGAIGLWTGWAALPPILLLAALAGLAAAVAGGRSRLDRMPFGTLMAMGAILWTALVALGLGWP